MTTRTVIDSDISGKSGASPVSFSLGPKAYTIDLANDEQEELKRVLEPYIQQARKKPDDSPGKTPGRRVERTTYAQRYLIRAWAEAQGLEIRDRGQIPNKIVSAFKKAHGGELPDDTEADLAPA